MKQKILITGGAGYIGSIFLQRLDSSLYEVTVVDNLSTGKRENILSGIFIEADIADLIALDEIFSKTQFDVIVHFAASLDVGESTRDPLKYYSNNVGGTLNLLKMCQKYNVKKLIFSSTASVYGESTMDKISEDAPLNPINPYGKSKMFCESIIRDYSIKNKDFSFVILRYFNVIGALVEEGLGQGDGKSFCLVKKIYSNHLKNKSIPVYGNDYPTADGTGVRDYICVKDLCDIHIHMLKTLIQNKLKFDTYNCGYSIGTSVLEFLSKVELITNKKIKIDYVKKRAGDPATLVADSSRLNEEFPLNPNGFFSALKDEYNWAIKNKEV